MEVNEVGEIKQVPEVFLGDKKQMQKSLNLVLILLLFGVDLSNYFHYLIPPGGEALPKDMEYAMKQIVIYNMGVILLNIFVLNLLFLVCSNIHKYINWMIVLIGINITVVGLELELNFIVSIPYATSYGYFYFRGIQMSFNVFLLLQMITNWKLTVPLCVFIWVYYGVRIFIRCCNMYSWIAMSVTVVLGIPYIEYCKSKYIKDLFNRYKEKKASEDGLIRLMNLLPQGIAYFNLEGKLQMLNSSCLKLFNQQYQQDIKLIEQRIYGLCETLIKRDNSLESYKLKKILQDLNFTYKQQQQQEILYETSLTTKNECILLEIRITLDTQENQERFIVVFHDITQASRNKYLEEINEYKSKLISSVSHELRTPLNSSMCMIELSILDESIPQCIKESLLKPAYFSQKILLNIINDILDFSRMNSQKLNLHFDNVKIYKVLQDVEQIMGFQIIKKGLRFILDIQQITEDYMIYTDENRLMQVLLNLLSNASKFTLKGHIKITVKEQNNDLSSRLPPALLFSVEDTGIGITQEDQQKLFSSFSKVERIENEQLNPMGAGLGLTISDKLVRMMKKDESVGLQLVSNYGQGSTFYFEIDSIMSRDSYQIPSEHNSVKEIETRLLNYTNKFQNINNNSCFTGNLLPQFNMNSHNTVSQIQTQEASVQQQQCMCPKLLLVDDNEFNLYTLSKILNLKNIQYDKAYNGQDAIDKVIERVQGKCGCCYKAIFMDCQMPILNGFEAATILTSMIRKSEIPHITIVACTAHALDEDKEKCKQSGMNIQLVKPISIKKIDDITKKLGLQ